MGRALIELHDTKHGEILGQHLQGRDLGEILASSQGTTLDEVLNEMVSADGSTSGASTDLVSKLSAAVIDLAESEIADGCQVEFCLDERVLAAVDGAHQLLAWRTVRDIWLATRNSSLDGMYLKKRLANELPDYELCNGAFCQSTKREAPPELSAEAEKVGGEVRWFAPERRLVAAVKFPRNFKGTDHARWCIKTSRSRSYSSSRLTKRNLNDEKWDSFVELFLKKFEDTIRVSAKNIRENGAIFELRIDIVDDDCEQKP